MYCTVCGFGGEQRASCPRCGASGTNLVDIPALAQGPMYHTYNLENKRDELGFTNPNLHRRIDREHSDVQPIPEPTPEDTDTSEYILELNEAGTAYNVIVYGGSSQIPKVPSTYEGLPITKISSEAFSGSDTYFVYLPEGVLEIE